VRSPISLAWAGVNALASLKLVFMVVATSLMRVIDLEYSRESFSVSESGAHYG
jgi:hypothetical protein